MRLSEISAVSNPRNADVSKFWKNVFFLAMAFYKTCRNLNTFDTWIFLLNEGNVYGLIYIILVSGGNWHAYKKERRKDGEKKTNWCLFFEHYYLHYCANIVHNFFKSALLMPRNSLLKCDERWQCSTPSSAYRSLNPFSSINFVEQEKHFVPPSPLKLNQD